MSSNQFQEFNIDELTAFINNNTPGDNLGFDEFSWDSSNVVGQSQPGYTGVGVWGDLNSYPDFPSPTSAPTSLYPTHGVFPNEGSPSPFYQGMAAPSLSPQLATTTPIPDYPRFTTVSPVPTLSHGSWSLSPDSHTVPITPTHHLNAQPQVIPNPDDLGFDFLTAAGNFSLPPVHPPPVCYPSYEALWPQCSQSGPSHFGTPFDWATGTTLPEIPLPAPVPSSSGPQRTRRAARERRRFDPAKSAKEKVDLEDGWDQTLVRFRAEFDTQYSVHDGRPSGGLVPEMALAKVNRFIKEDLKRSPLQNTKAGEGKRSRSGEDYLKGLLKAIRRVAPTSILAGGGSNESDTNVAALSSLAKELEMKLAAVNQQPALRQSAGSSKPGRETGGEQKEKLVKKNGTEKGRRDTERHHLERISRLFRATGQRWSKKDVLSLAALFLLYGSEAFPRDFVEVRSHLTGL